MAACSSQQANGSQQVCSHEQASSTQRGYLSVRRRVTKAGRSEFFLCSSATENNTAPAGRGDPPAAAAAAAAPVAFPVGAATAWELGTCMGRWRAVSPEGLRRELEQHGIQTQAIDR